MDDRILGKEPPAKNSQESMGMLSSAAERRAFQRFQSECTSSSGQTMTQDTALTIWLRDHSCEWQRRRLHTAAQMQAEEIRKHRWIESEKQKCDVGKAAHINWVRMYAAEWRTWFENHYDGPLVDCD